MKKIIGLICLLFSSMTFASDFGLSLMVPLIPKDPADLKGIRAGLLYEPPSMQWTHWQIYFEGSAGHWWIPSARPHHSMTILAIAPYFRFYIARRTVSPFLEASIGPSYLSDTKIDHRDLGIHFAFQDHIAIGATLGKEQKFTLSLSAIHYSDGSISHHNSGITVPLLLKVDYQF